MIKQEKTHPKQIQNLALPLTAIKGIGPRRAHLMARKGVLTILDLLYFLPTRYENRTQTIAIRDADPGSPALVRGKVLYGKEERFSRSRKRLYRIMIHDGHNSLELIWFHYKKPHLDRLGIQDRILLAYGKVTINKGLKQIIHPDVTPVDQDDKDPSFGILPVYPLINGVSANQIRSWIEMALDTYLKRFIDPLPEDLAEELGLPNLTEAIRFVHFPPSDQNVERLDQRDSPQHKRLIFDRFFLVMFIIAARKKYRTTSRGPLFSLPSHRMDELKACIPFELTTDQRVALKDIADDMTSGRPMNRLLMGDVGCGKTIVAAAAAFFSISNGKQVAIMVPTQVLTEQHMVFFTSLSEKLPIKPIRLTGQLTPSERRDVYKGIKDGTYNLIIGTHALIQEKLTYSDLGLVIIDEQHRFGVKARALMERKGNNPHLLIMTATPIPRTLAMTAYGDMDISEIRVHPGGRLPVITRLVAERQKREVFNTLQEKLMDNQQAIVICPVIDRTDGDDVKNATDMFEKLKNLFSPHFRVGLVHGRLPFDRREKVIKRFREGHISILVATTVIEVGIHVPNATVMIIEHPERFGLAQLHQMRGRVGRGEKRGRCFLMVTDRLPDLVKSRLKIITECHDGFEIAQRDLEWRGHGELTGMRQAGAGELDFSEMLKEPEWLFKAKQAAEQMVEKDPQCLRQANSRLKGLVDSILSRPID
ncbi:MAG: ATP-dependent DNA helicase RecG [Deltaproteobacteria bacterium]|nr:ATP-dependent DNA helicase RecG [Deltaproteobacteria bacterium]